MVMDANKDGHIGDTYALFQALAMKEAILTWHPSKSPPATYNQNLQQQLIEGSVDWSLVWASFWMQTSVP
jgi:hypothetical protein